MQSNYKKLGRFIRPVNNRDRDESVTLLLGVSIQKKFIPSIANTIGTDMSTYKIIQRNQFAYGPVTSRNGDRISIALLEDYDEAIVSQAYTCFTVKDETELLPQYLMMWFRRPEFDRYARFMSHGSAREIFSWDELCHTELPVPSISKQREIVAEYHAIQNRIALNNQFIQTLETTAQAIYKQWFVEFEFPNEASQPYKSSGGEMVDSALGEIPKGWEVRQVGELVKCNSSNLTPRDKFDAIEYLDTGSITNNEIEGTQILTLGLDEIPSRAKRKVKDNDIVFSTVRPNLRHFGVIKNPSKNMIASTGFAVLSPNQQEVFTELIYLFITSEENLQSLQARAEMSVSTYPSINAEDLLNLDFVLPDLTILVKAKRVFVSIFELADSIRKQNRALKPLTSLLLSKLATVETAPSAPKPAATGSAQLALSFA